MRLNFAKLLVRGFVNDDIGPPHIKCPASTLNFNCNQLSKWIAAFRVGCRKCAVASAYGSGNTVLSQQFFFVITEPKLSGRRLMIFVFFGSHVILSFTTSFKFGV